MSTTKISLLIFLFFLSSCTNTEKVMPFKKDGKWGLINSKGDVILSPKYNSIDFSNYGKNLELIKVEDSLGKTGYIDFKGNEVIPLIYDRGTNFTGNFAFVCVDGSYPIIIDKSGNEKQVEGVMMASKFKNGYSVFQKARRFGFLNEEGEIVISPRFLNAESFSQGLAAVQCDQCYPDIDEDPSFGKWGYIDESGKIKISPEYDLALEFDENELAIVVKDKKAFFIDKSSNKVFDKVFDEAYKFADGVSRVKIGDNYGFIDLKGNEIIPFVYSSATDFFDGFASVELKDGEWGVIDKSGKFVVQPIYKELSVPFGGSVFFEKENQKGILSIGNEMIAFNDFDGFYKSLYSDLIISTCKIDFEKIIKDIFSEDTFPYFSNLTSKGFSNIEFKIKNNNDFVAWENSYISLKPKYLSENSMQESGSLYYEDRVSGNKRLPRNLKTTIKMPAYDGEDIEEIRKFLIEGVNKLDNRIEEVYETNVDPSMYDTSLVWEYEEYFIVASYKWDIFARSSNDLFLLDLYVSFK